MVRGSERPIASTLARRVADEGPLWVCSGMPSDLQPVLRRFSADES